ncbi:MAG: methyltransferase domain-containing protein [Candidatus Omnitrophota bacterium]
MRRKLLDILVCPKCKKTLTLKDEVASGERIKSGTLKCRGCEASYEVRDYIPRFVASDSYVGNFSLEWTIHSRTQVDNAYSQESLKTFAQKTGFAREDIRGKLVLDVGCGSGRFADIALKWGGEVVGVDMSYSVDAVRKNFANKDKLDLVQADIFYLPFKDNAFDIIYSIGVLHHTKDCKAAFKRLPSLLRKGGKIAIWVYSAHLYRGIDARVMELYRQAGSRLPKRLLYLLCAMASFSYPLWNGRFMYKFWHMVLPGFLFHSVPVLTDYRKYDWRLLDNFDFYSPRFQSKHSYPEVFSWFKEENLTNIKPLDFEVAVQGEK